MPYRRRSAVLAAALLAAALSGCAMLNKPLEMFARAAPPEAAPQPVECPKEVPTGTRCLGGRDSAGAHVLIALPAGWKDGGVLVLHAHGGPLLGEPRAQRAVEDLQRWAIMVKAGYAWAASTFAQGGVAVRAAAVDTERLRRIFVQHVGKPGRTILHGQSWGASVAAKGAEMHTTRDAGGRLPYDAVLLTSGVLGGGTRSYDVRLDLRVLYQHLCGNHPRADEPQYPLWMGLPEDSKLTAQDLAARTRECLGLGMPAAQRTPEQARKLATIVNVLKIPERSVQAHLNWGTFFFRDIAQRYRGKPVFGNVGARYRGSSDDNELNLSVARYRADRWAVSDFAADTDPNGRIPVPVLTVHGIGDATAFVELEHRFWETMKAARRDDALVQTFTSHDEHSYLADAVYPALMQALLDWVDRGEKPTPESVAARCEKARATYGGDCRFVPPYQPPPLDTRVAPRER